MSQPICQVRILTPETDRYEHLCALTNQGAPGLLQASCRHLRGLPDASPDDGDVFLIDHLPAVGCDALRVTYRLRADGFRQPVVLLLPPGTPADAITFAHARLAGAADCLPADRTDAFILPRVVRSACLQAEVEKYAPPSCPEVPPCEKTWLFDFVTERSGSMAGRIDARGTVVTLVGSLYDSICPGQGVPVGRSAFQVFPDAGSFLRRALAGEDTVFVTVDQHEGKERRLYTFLFHDHEHSRSVVFLTRNITEQDGHTTRALSESRHQFQMLLARSLDAILLVDDNGLCIEANEAASHLLGHARELLVGRYTDEIGFQGVDPFQIETSAATRFHGASTQGPLSFTRPDGQGRLLDYATYRATPQFHLCILRDQTEQRRLEREILEVSDLEQERFSRDLHDGLGQHLAGVGYLTEALAARLETRAAPEAVAAREIGSLVSQAIVQTREIARGVYPPDLTAGQLPEVLARLAESFRAVYGTACAFEQMGDEPMPPLSRQTLLHLYRITQEAANNAHRHGQPTTVTLRLDCRDGWLTLSVIDDGRGFVQPVDEEAATEKEDRPGGLGLGMMHYRATLLGGTLAVRPGPDGEGTEVSCVLEVALCQEDPAAPA